MKHLLPYIAAKSGSSGGRWIPLKVHSLDTSHIMKYLLNSWVPQRIVQQISADSKVERICMFLAMVHDIGKITRIFQYRISHSIPGHLERLQRIGVLEKDISTRDADKVSHARAGQVILDYFGCPADVSCIVGSHHGKPQDETPDPIELQEFYANLYFGYEQVEQSKWKSVWKEWIDYSLRAADLTSMKELPQLSMSGQMLAAGLLIMADWIASNQEYFPPIEIGEELSDEEMEARADQAWQTLNLPGFWDAQCYYMDDEAFSCRFSFLPNAVQKAVLDVIQNAVEPGLIILEAQMGVGKTEAALAAAEYLNTQRQCGGLFFGLPTQATANGIFHRLLSWAKSQAQDITLGIRLAHGAAALNDDYAALFQGSAQIDDETGGLTVHPWFEGSKQALLSNFVVGTVDQLLMAALKQKHLMLRHLGLAGKVVIIDECHAYDAYMNTYLERALRWLGSYRTPVILLSATLPSARRAALVDAYLGRSSEGVWRRSTTYPLLTWTDSALSEPVQQLSIQVQQSAKPVSIHTGTVSELTSFLQENCFMEAVQVLS